MLEEVILMSVRSSRSSRVQKIRSMFSVGIFSFCCQNQFETRVDVISQSRKINRGGPIALCSTRYDKVSHNLNMTERQRLIPHPEVFELTGSHLEPEM